MAGQEQQQQVPTGQSDHEGLAISQEQIGALQSSITGQQDRLEMPKVDPSMQKPGMKDILASGALSMFVPFLGQAVMQHAKQSKEHQVNEALNEFQALDSIWNTAYLRANVEAKGEANKAKELATKYAQEDPRLMAMFGGPQGKKRLKNFSKVFQQPWLNDGKTTPHTEALQRFMKLKPASKMMEHAAEMMQSAQGASQAQGGAQGMAGGQGAPQGQPNASAGPSGGQSGSGPLSQGQPQQGQPQGQPGQGDQKGTDLFSMLPHQVAPPDPKALTPYSEYLRAIDSVRNRYDSILGADGTIYMKDKRTGDLKVPKILDENGKEREIKGFIRGREGPMIVDGVPIGWYRNAHGYTPQSPEWTAQDAKNLAEAQAGWAKSKEEKDARVKLSATARANAWAATRLYDAYDAQEESIVKINPLDYIANKGRYAPVGPALQLRNRVALFNEIEKNGVPAIDRAITQMGDEVWDANVREQLTVALRSDDPRSYWEKFLESENAAKMTAAQQQFAIAVISMDESALSLRSLGGLGQGSDQLRNAIIRMLPGAGTPSGEYARAQMKLFKGEVKQLKTSIPKIGNLPDKDTGGKKQKDF